MLKLLADSDATVRVAAARSLAVNQSARPALNALLYDENASVRKVAIELLVTSQAAKHLPLTLLDDADATVREAAARSLAGRTEAASKLHQLLERDVQSVRAAAAFALASMPTERPALIDFLLTVPEALDTATAELLIEDKCALPLFRKCRNHSVVEVQSLRALAAAGDEQVLSEMRNLLLGIQSRNGTVAEPAFQVLASNETTRPLVQQYLGDHDVTIRREAYESLIRHEKDKTALLRKATFDTSSEIRSWALTALAKDPDTRPLIRKFLADGDVWVRRDAVKQLAVDPDSRVLIRHLLSDADTITRIAAINALAEDDEAIAKITELTQTEDVQVRVVAMETLLRHRDSDGQDEIVTDRTSQDAPK